MHSAFAVRTSLWLPCLLVALLADPHQAAAQLEVEGIDALQPVGNDSYSTSIAIDGDTLAVGTSIVSPNWNGADQSAAVAVFRRDAAGTPDDPQDDTWIQEAVLANPLEADSNFGYQLGLDGDQLIVGAPGRFPAGTHPGAAVIYRRAGGAWSHEATLQAADSTPSTLFGFDVALDGEFAVVGAVRDSELTVLAGAVYVFQREGGLWVLRTKLHGDLATAAAVPSGAGARFGCAVAAEGGTIVVGADGEGLEPMGYVDVGGVYVFDRDDAGTADQSDDTWPERAHIQPRSTGGPEFGSDVALEGGRFIAGSPSDDLETMASGSASIYRRDDVGTPGDPADDIWRKEAILGPGAAVPVGFGRSVDLQHGFAVVASGYTLDHEGTLHVFRLTGERWVRVADIAAERAVGCPVACDGVTAAIGQRAYGPELLGAPFQGPGGAHLYALESGPWSWLGDALAGDGAAPALFGVGQVRVGATLALTIHAGPPSAPALLVIGASTAGIPFKGGTLVPSPDRLLPLALDAAGGASLAVPAAGAVGLGTSLFLQVWITDADGPQGFTATNALALELR